MPSVCLMRRGFGRLFRRPRRSGPGFYPGYWIRWTDGHGKRRQEWGGATKTEAEARLARHAIAAQQQRRDGGRRPRDLTFAEAVPEILAVMRARLRPSTAAEREIRYRQLGPLLGDRPMRRVTRQDIDDMIVAMRARGLAVSTTRSYVQVIAAAFEVAVELGIAEVNPCRGARLPRGEERPIRWLSAVEIDALLAAMPERMRGIVTVIADTGLRGSEARALLWTDFAEGTVTVRESKSGRPRVVPTTARVEALLKTLPRVDGEPRVFPIDKTTFSEDFRAAADRCGFRDVSAHTLRHAYASGLVQAGADLPTVARLCGHSDIRVTMRYAQWAPADAAVRAVRALEEARGRHPTGSPGSP